MNSTATQRGKKLMNILTWGTEEEAMKLLKDHVDLNVEVGGDYAIHMAARKGLLSVIKQLKNMKADLSKKNINGNTPMHYAARGGYLALVKYLRENGADINISNKEGFAPLHLAVIDQPMEIIERLVDLGMDPNVRNKVTNEVPLHVAMKFGRQEAMEGLLVKGARHDIKDKENRLPEQVAKSGSLKATLRQYCSMLTVMKPGSIQANGMKITRQDLAQAMKIDRVGIIIVSMDIPQEFPAGFYCRREKTENATVVLTKYEQEYEYSDVFHIRIFDVNKSCNVKILLPLYNAPSAKDEIIIRFINYHETDKILQEYVKKQKVYYCLLETLLLPETVCTCVVYVRSKQEVTNVSPDGQTITSQIAKDFLLDIPAGSFKANTTLSLKVFEADADSSTSSGSSKDKKCTGPLQTNERTDSIQSNSVPTHLVTDIYQITLNGQQPSKGITINMPLGKGMETKPEELAIVAVGDNDLDAGNTLEILPHPPKIVNRNLVFEVSHFSIYVASWKHKLSTIEEQNWLQSEIVFARKRSKHGTFITLTKYVEGYKHTLIVDCGTSAKSADRRSKWLEGGFEQQSESDDLMIAPGDTFFVHVEGNAKLSIDEDATCRKIQFSLVRSSYQVFEIVQSQFEGTACVNILQGTDMEHKRILQLPLQLYTPPTPTPTPTPTGQNTVSMRNGEDPTVSETDKKVNKLQQIYAPKKTKKTK